MKNPLCGKQGATYIFGSQKGVTEEQKDQIDEAMRHYADVTKESLDCDFADCEGAGAAGGLGYAFLSYLAGELIPGCGTDFCRATGLEEKMKNADVVVTGEGRLDAQTVMGKAPGWCCCSWQKNIMRKSLHLQGVLHRKLPSVIRQGLTHFSRS